MAFSPSNKSAPIGVFDSGLGGLTIVKALLKVLPKEKIIYFGDTAHLPYGDKSPDKIREYVKEITEFLLTQKVKAIVIACNTASAVAAATVREAAQSIPVIDVINPAVEAAIEVSQDKRIGIIATKTTIASHIYNRLIQQKAPEAITVEKATPLLVPLIEEGWLHNQISQEVIASYLQAPELAAIDTLILGCTHYPLIKQHIAAFFEEKFSSPVALIDSSIAVAVALRTALADQNLLNNTNEKPQHRFFTSDFSTSFQDAAKLFLAQSVSFEKVSLEGKP